MSAACRTWLFPVVLLLLSGCDDGPAVEARSQTVAFAAAPALTVHGTATVSARASSGLPVSYSSLTPAVCTVDSSSGLVTDLTTGMCTIAADQSGDSTYAPAPQATQGITVSGTQTISFGDPPTLEQYGYGRVSATASSGLAVSYSSQTAGVCSVGSGSGVVYAEGTGTCVIAADQAGDDYNGAAPQVTQSITVNAHVGAATVPGAPMSLSATAGMAAATTVVSFTGPSSAGGSPVTSYTVVSSPAGVTASNTASPITVNCPVSCEGYSFAVFATNALGDGAASDYAHVVTRYKVVTTFYEPETQPNDTIFTGTFALDSTTGTVSDLAGRLTESMTGPPMTIVMLTHQLSIVGDGAGGLLVSTFALNTTDTYAEGGFAADSEGLYFGYPSALNPSAGGVGNSFVTIYVNPKNPVAGLTPAQINRLSYGDCAAGGMMGDVCMTGYSGYGTMGGYPVSQVVSRQ